MVSGATRVSFAVARNAKNGRRKKIENVVAIEKAFQPIVIKDMQYCNIERARFQNVYIQHE